MSEYDKAHELEQAEAALAECVRSLRRLGVACVAAVMTERGHVYRQMSAPNGVAQVQLMHVLSTKFNLELGSLAISAAEMVDEDNSPTYLDEHRKRIDEGLEDENE